MALVEILTQKGYQFLWVDNDLWMWDVPGEQLDQRELAEQAHGDVLVAGYGLGLVQKYLLENENVASVLTVEKLPEIIAENKRIGNPMYGEIEIADFYTYETPRQFDTVIGDTWKDQSFREVEEYVKYKNKALTLLKPDGKVLGWGADYFETRLSHI